MVLLKPKGLCYGCVAFLVSGLADIDLSLLLTYKGLIHRVLAQHGDQGHGCSLWWGQVMLTKVGGIEQLAYTALGIDHVICKHFSN